MRPAGAYQKKIEAEIGFDDPDENGNDWEAEESSAGTLITSASKR